MELILTLEQVQTLVRGAFPSGAGNESLIVEALEPGYTRIRLPFKKWMTRPGNVISGPTMMTAVDTAMYVAVLAHIGAELMAVTADMNLRFVNKAVLGDVIADARILKLGRKLIIMESRVYISAAPTVLAMHATGSYARPGPA